MKFSRKTIYSSLLVVILVFATAGTALANSIVGPRSSQSPYLLRSQAGVVIKASPTVGDSVKLKPYGVTPYRTVGIPAGLVAYDNGFGASTLLMNHAIGN